MYPTCKDFNSLINITESLINAVNIQSDLLFDMLEALQLEQSLASQIFYRWQTDNKLLIRDFAPYAHFVYKIETTFRLGVVYDLITTRPTNKIDCEYLFYLPFCNIFSSRDNLQKEFAINFLEQNQTLIDGDELKDDLNNIITILEKEDKELNIDWSTSFELEPPANKNSLAYKMWEKYIPLWSPNWFYRKRKSPTKLEIPSDEFRDRIDKFEFIDTDPFEKFKDEDYDFISIERYVTLEDQCPCGSGRKFKECCYEKIKE